MDKDKFYKPNEKDMAVMKKIHHHHMASMNHSTGSPEHKHHIQQVMKHKSQLSKDAQKLLMMGEGTYKVEIEGLPKMYMDTDNPGELRRDLRKIVRKVDMVKNVERVQKSQVRKDLQLKIQGKDPEEIEELVAPKPSPKGNPSPPTKKGELDFLKMKHRHFSSISSNPTRKAEHDRVKNRIKKLTGKAPAPIKELDMGQGVEVKKTAVGDRPKGYGWSLKKSGQQTGKDHDVWHRVTKPVAPPKIGTRSPMFNSKNESFFFVKEDQIKRDGAKIKKAYDAIATEDMNVITKHLKKQGIEHDHDRGELYVKRQDHRDVMNHLSDLMKKKMIKSKPPVTAEKLDKEDEPFVKNLIKNLRKGAKTHGGQADDLEKAMKESLNETKVIVGKHLDKAGIPHSYAGGPEPMVRQKDAGRAKELINKLHKDGTIKRNPGVTVYDKGPNIRPISKALKNKLGMKEAVGAGKYSAMNLKKAKELMSPAKHREDGVKRIMKGMKVTYKQANKFHDDVMKSHGFKTQNEDKGRGPTGIAYSLPKGHPDAENPATRKKYPERQTDKYKADFAKNSPIKLSGKFSKNEEKEKLSPKAQRAKDAQARIDKKFAPGGSYSKGADQIRKVIAKNESVDEIVTRRGKPIFQPKPDDSPERTAMIKSVQKSLNKRRERLAKAKKDRQAAHAQGKPFDTLKALGYGKAVEANEEKKKKTGLAGKAEKSGMPLGILKTVYNRGMAAWKTGHRPGTTPQQWGHARVNSFITKSSGTWGKADKDLADKVRARKK